MTRKYPEIPPPAGPLMVKLITSTIDQMLTPEYADFCHQFPGHKNNKVINVTLPRQMGHTVAAAQILAQYSSSRLILSKIEYSQWWKGEFYYLFEHQLRDNIWILPSHTAVLQRSLSQTLAGKKLDCDVMVVDNASDYPDNSRSILEAYLGPYTKAIVYLG